MTLNHKEKRELYKAMRSAHDGICPTCGGKVTRWNHVYTCEFCSFHLTAKETTVIKGWRELFHSDLKEIMERWRNENV